MLSQGVKAVGWLALSLWLVLVGWLPAVGQVPLRTTWDARRVQVEAAIAWLRTQQLPDGSFGTAWGVTADAVYVIGLYMQTYGVAAEYPGGPRWTRNGRSALDALADFAGQVVASGDAGYIAKVLRAVVMAGENPRNFGGVDLIAALWETYDPATGRFHSGNNFRQALAIQALRLAGEEVPARAVQSLLAEQRPNGGWGWPYQGSAVDVDTTGLVMATLVLNGLSPADPALQRAVQYVQGAQNPDGGWGMDVGRQSNANSTALALLGLVAVGENPQGPPYTGRTETGVWRDPLVALLRFQAPDGGFRWTVQYPGTRLLATTDALPVLMRPWPSDHPLTQRIFTPGVWR